MTTRFWIARHGQVAAEWHGRLYGGLDVPLSPEGERQSLDLAARIRTEALDLVVSSGLARAEFAAQQLRESRGLMVRIEPDLAEIDRGDWGGWTFEELERRQPGAWAAWMADPATRRPPNGESLHDLAQRVLPCLTRLAAEFPGGTIAVVAHSWVLRVAICATLGLPWDRARAFYLPPAGLVRLDWPLPSQILGGVGDSAPIPVLAGMVLDRPPEPHLRWNRGPRR